MLIKRIFFSFLFIIIGWMLCSLYNTMKKKEEIPLVTTITVKRERLKEKISLSTKVSLKDIINLTSFANSFVEKIYVKQADVIEEGSLLIELKKDELLNSLRKEELNLEKQRKREAQLEDIPNHPEVIDKDEEIKRLEWEKKRAKDELEDAKSLYSKKAVAFREQEAKELEVKRQEISLNKAIREKDELLKRLIDEKKETNVNIKDSLLKIDELKKQLEGCRVISPISGVIKKINVEKNSKVEIGSILLSLASTDELVARGSLKETNFFLVKYGQKTELYSEALGKRFKGIVLKVTSASTKEQKEEQEGWEMVSLIKDPSGLREGMELSCDIIIKEKEKESLVIPPEALYEEDSVLVVEKGKIRKKKIEVGESTTDSIEILSGLKQGEMVVIQYEEEIREGMRVKVK
ncbi:MAG: efflux RND transporter periplasmic adaptor subunit [bacterium]